MMKINLPDAVASTQDLASMSLELHEYSKWYSHAAILKRTGNKHVSDAPALTPAATELLHAWTAKNPLSQSSLDELIEFVKTYSDSASVITITLAAPATRDIKSLLVSWCRTNISPNILVTFKFNATLLGGMVVQRGSRIFDWSLRRDILNEKNKFPEVLRSV
jgi:ATP synthase delta (OSCP) subunit